VKEKFESNVASEYRETLEYFKEKAIGGGD